MQIQIPDDCCAMARQMIGHGLDPETKMEFMRGDVVCLRGTARAFARRRVKYNNRGTPYHALLTQQERSSGVYHIRSNDDPVG